MWLDIWILYKMISPCCWYAQPIQYFHYLNIALKNFFSRIAFWIAIMKEILLIYLNLQSQGKEIVLSYTRGTRFRFTWNHFSCFTEKKLLRRSLKFDSLPNISLYKKWSFPLSISSVNVTKSAGNCGFGHIY